MRHAHSLALGLGAVLGSLLVACSFTLDFDGLQGGEATGGSSSGGSAGSGGSPCGVCNDNDPCTRDLCDTSGAAPACVFEAQRLVPDGMSIRKPVEEVHDLNLTAAGGKFYLSLFARESGVDDISLWSFGRDGAEDTFAEGASFSALKVGTPLEGMRPASGAGLLAKVVGIGTQIFASLALRESDNVDAQVYVLSFDQDFNLLDLDQISAVRSFAVPNLRRRPLLWEVANGPVHAGWLTRAGAVFLELDSLAVTHVVTAAGAQAIVPLDSPDGAGPARAGVLVATEDRVITQLAAGTPIEVESCIDASAGPVTSAASARITGNLWYTWWSRSGGSNAATDISLLGCTAQGCSAASCADGDRGPSPGVRNPDFTFVTRPEIEPDILNLVGATPTVSADVAELALTVTSIRLLANSTEPEFLGGSSVVVSSDNRGGGAGPDRPKLAVLGSDRLAVSWVEPGPQGHDLRVERYRMCYPQDR